MIIFLFNDRSKSKKTLVSRTCGTFLSSTGSSNNKDAARIASDSFFDPDILIVPETLQGPLITNLSIYHFAFAKVIPV